jgi:hypothetical protein
MSSPWPETQRGRHVTNLAPGRKLVGSGFICKHVAPVNRNHVASRTGHVVTPARISGWIREHNMYQQSRSLAFELLDYVKYPTCQRCILFELCLACVQLLEKNSFMVMSSGSDTNKSVKLTSISNMGNDRGCLDAYPRESMSQCLNSNSKFKMMKASVGPPLWP